MSEVAKHPEVLANEVQGYFDQQSEGVARELLDKGIITADEFQEFDDMALQQRMEALSGLSRDFQNETLIQESRVAIAAFTSSPYYRPLPRSGEIVQTLPAEYDGIPMEIPEQVSYFTLIGAMPRTRSINSWFISVHHIRILWEKRGERFAES